MKPMKHAAWTALILGAGISGFLLAQDNKETPLSDVIDPNVPERPIFLLSTDKMLYKPGETIYFRGAVLDGFSYFPFRDCMSVKLEIRGPRGDVLFSTYGKTDHATAGISFKIPEGTPGGQYTASFFSTENSSVGERKFEIRAYRQPRLKSQIVFKRDAYIPGETASAVLECSRAEGGTPENALIDAFLTAGGENLWTKENLSFDSKGLLNVDFPIPATLRNSDATLVFRIRDGGVVENASKSVPLLLNNETVVFYPESGDLVAGLNARVYFQASLDNGKPAALDARLTEENSTGTLAVVRDAHEGRGTFSFIPEHGKRYILRSKNGKNYPLPEVKKSGASVLAMRSSYPFREKIAVNVLSTPDSDAAEVSLYKRERLLSKAPVTPGKPTVLELDPFDSEGVLTVTVKNSEGKPLAERLVFRDPKYTLNLAFDINSKAFVPGGEVTVTITATDSNGAPVEAVTGLSVTNDAVLQMTDRREQHPRLPVMAYLENEVLDLADAGIYLDKNNPAASVSIDLLLGTQGWRRFIRTEYKSIVLQHEAAANRAIAKYMPVRLGAAPSNVILRGKPEVWKLEEKMANAVDPDAAKIIDEAVPQPALKKEFVPAVAMPLKIKRNDEKPSAANEIMAEDRDDNTFRAKRLMHSYVTVREYAFRARPNRRPNERLDFTETIYWNAGLRTNPRDGTCIIRFSLPDTVGSFRILADAFGRNGALGTAERVFDVREPFYIEPKMPVSITAGDIMELPLALVNSTDRKLEQVHLSVKADGLKIEDVPAPRSLAPGERGRTLIRIAAEKTGTYPLTISVAAGEYTDTVTHTVKVQPRLFPLELNSGGILSPGKNFTTILNIPAKIEPGSMTTSVKLYSTPLATMEDALSALLRRPSGCFEQTSSTNYPVVMIQQYFTNHHGIAPDKIEKTGKIIEEGYKRLIGFKSKNGGYEWFGGDPGHEALTAYGLMQFAEMAPFVAVDSSMLKNTREWLLSKRDGEGGFKRNERALDSFGRAPVPTTNAYIVWALLESGENPETLEKEIEAVRREAEQTADSYQKALAANILHLAGKNADADQFASQLAAKQNKEGFVGNARTTITNSAGNAKNIETTSLAVIAWLRISDQYTINVENAIRYLAEICKNGRFSSTQSTILALKAINAYDKAHAKVVADGSVQLYIDGKAFGKPVHFTKDSSGVIELPDFSAAMTPGEHRLELRMTEGGAMPLTVTIQCATPTPDSAKECALSLKTTLSNSKIPEGEALELHIEVTNKQKDAVSMPLAVIGIPGGAELRHDQLKELVKARRIHSYEVIDGKLVLYWRALKGGETVRVPVSLLATIPGTWNGTASSAYLYYADEFVNWVLGTGIAITP